MFGCRLRDCSLQWHFLLSLVIFMNIVINVNEIESQKVFSTTFCLSISNTLKARHKSCFLRPDTGPCRSDIVQWYFDAKQAKCYRFFWGGCQGNGNKFDSKEECYKYCWLNDTMVPQQRPHFCSLAFDFGSCFGHYERWYWDNLYKTCKRRIYSGCGGNQNNFETLAECTSNCLAFPNNTYGASRQFTTCVPLNLPELQKKRKKRDLNYFVTPPIKRRRPRRKRKHSRIPVYL